MLLHGRKYISDTVNLVKNPWLGGSGKRISVSLWPTWSRKLQYRTIYIKKNLSKKKKKKRKEKEKEMAEVTGK